MDRRLLKSQMKQMLLITAALAAACLHNVGVYVEKLLSAGVNAMCFEEAMTAHDALVLT